MYDMGQWCREHGIPVTEDQLTAEKYVRSRGERFMIDFGYENVIAKADALFDKECNALLTQIGRTL